MGINIPPRPPDFNGDPEDPNYQANLMKWQQQMQNWSLIVQTALQQQSREADMASNQQKSAHDALMAIVNNLR